MVIKPPYRDQLRRVGLGSVRAVLACEGDRLAAWSRTTDTIEYRPADMDTTFYIKRYHYPRWRQRFRGMLRGTLLKASRAKSEFHVLRRMRQLGIQAVRPVAFGERRAFGFVRSCFLITEAVPDAMALSTFITKFGRHRGGARAWHVRQEVLCSLARQVRHMHAMGFVHRDLFWRNVLIRSLPEDRFEFYFLDAAVGKRIRLQQRRQDSIVGDVAAMGALAPHFCSKSDQLRFLRTYLDKRRLDKEDLAWIRRVQRHSDRFREAELMRLERGQVFDPPPRGAASPA